MQDLEDEARVYTFFAHCDLVVYFRHSLNFFIFCFVKGSRNQRKTPSPRGIHFYVIENKHTQKK